MRRAFHLLLAFAATAVLLQPQFSSGANAGGEYRVGDIVQADFFGTGHWIKGRINALYPAQGPVSQYAVEDVSTPGARGAVNQLAPASVRPWLHDSVQAAQPAIATRAANPHLAAAIVPTRSIAPASGQFKVGDRILSSINSASGEYQPCTIMGPLGQGVYPVRCDPWKGRSFTDWGAFPQFIKPWPGATPVPIVRACSFSVPGGTVTRNSPPNAQTFQKVIYDMASVSKEGQWGMTFTKFQIGSPYKNRAIGNGSGGAEMERPQAAQGALIYPIVSEYVRCVNLDASYDERTVVDVNWACMKNRDGDWDCPTNSTREIVKRERVPK